MKVGNIPSFIQESNLQLTIWSLCVLSCSVVSDSATPWTVVCQASLSMGFSRQEYWSGLSFPSPGDLPNTRIKPVSLTSPELAGRFFTPSHLGGPKATAVTQLFFPDIWGSASPSSKHYAPRGCPQLPLIVGRISSIS